MFKIYKNTFYSNNKAFRESEPEDQSILPLDYLLNKPKNLKIDQQIYILDYFNKNVDIHINLKTIYDKELSDNVNSLWVTISLPNDRHIDWIIYENKIQLEYFVENYGYTNYLFQTIYKGKADPIEKIPLEITDPEQIWIYDCTNNRKMEKSTMINENVTEINKIFKSGSQILKMLNEMKITESFTPKDIHSLIEKSKFPELITDLISLITNFNLPIHPLFKLIHELQCYIHKTKSMFELEKLWEGNKKQAPKTTSKEAPKK